MLQTSESRLRDIINKSITERAADNSLNEKIILLEKEKNEFLTEIANLKSTLISKSDEIKTLEKSLISCQEELGVKIDYIKQHELSLDSQNSQMIVLESQVQQLEANKVLQEQMLQAKNEEIQLKRRNETRLLDLNTSLSTKNKQLEDDVKMLKANYCFDYIPDTVQSLTILEYTVIQGIEMCYCELQQKSVGMFSNP